MSPQLHRYPHDVGGDDRLVVLPARHLAQVEQVADDRDQEAVLLGERMITLEFGTGAAEAVRVNIGTESRMLRGKGENNLFSRPSCAFHPSRNVPTRTLVPPTPPLPVPYLAADNPPQPCAMPRAPLPDSGITLQLFETPRARPARLFPPTRDPLIGHPYSPHPLTGRLPLATWSSAIDPAVDPMAQPYRDTLYPPRLILTLSSSSEPQTDRPLAACPPSPGRPPWTWCLTRWPNATELPHNRTWLIATLSS